MKRLQAVTHAEHMIFREDKLLALSDEIAEVIKAGKMKAEEEE